MSLTPEQIYIYTQKKNQKKNQSNKRKKKLWETEKDTVMQTAVKPWTYAHTKKAVVNNMHFTIFQEPFIFFKN